MDFSKKKYILLDLDGTVTDSGPGIMNAAAYALKHFGIEENDRNNLRRFVGPPLKDSFLDYYGVDAGDEAVAVFREYYHKKGVYENEVYPDMDLMLKKLHEAGKVLVISSSKHEHMVDIVLSHFDIGKYFDIVVGANTDETRSEKNQILDESFLRLLERENGLADSWEMEAEIEHGDSILMISGKRYTKQELKDMDAARKKRLEESKLKISLGDIKRDAVMIGDRSYDINGAMQHGVQSIGVTYGYGSKEEFKNADATADSVKDLGKILGIEL